MAGRLEGKVSIVTGGGTGIGAAVAEAFINEGAKVVINGRRKEKLEEFASKFPADRIACCAGDISNLKDAESIVNTAIEKFGKLNILVNNAAIDPPGKVTDIPVEQWLEIINININGTFYVTRFAIPKMIEAGGGSIVNISSLAGVRAIPGMPAYSTTKAAMQGFTNAVALDYGDMGIRINTVSPGATKTEMLALAMSGLAESQKTDVEGAFKLLTRFNPVKRAAEPSEIAPAVVFFASDESSCITGQNLLVDGGATVVDPCGAAVSSLGNTWG